MNTKMCVMFHIMNAAARKIQAAFRARHGPYTNRATSFALTVPSVQGRFVTMTVSDMDFDDVLSRDLPPGVDEVLGYALVGTLPRLRVARDKTIGDYPGITSMKFKVQFTAPNASATVTIHQTGKVMIWTDGPYERVARFLGKYYGIGNAKAKVVSISGRFYVNREIDVFGMFDEVSAKVPRSVASLGLPPDDSRRGMMTVTFVDPPISLNLYNTGTVTFKGAKSDAEKGVAAKLFKSLFDTYKVSIKTALIDKELAKPQTAGRNKEKLKAYAVNMRVARAPNYSARKNGHYVRPGPDGKPRFYELPANTRLVRTKTIKAYAAAGVNIPGHVKNALGITNNVVAPPKNAKANGPANFSAQKNGFYVRPGPSFRPTWYKIPTDKTSGRKTVIKAYQKAGVRIPAHVKALFGIDASPNLNRPGGHVIDQNKKGFFRINGKQARRYTVEALVKIARNLNIAAAHGGMKRENLEYLITKKFNGPIRQPVNVKVNGVSYTFLGDMKVKRNYAPDILGKTKPSRVHDFDKLKLAEQRAVAYAYLNRNQHKEWNALLPQDRYMALLAVKHGRGPNGTPARNENNNKTPNYSQGSNVNENFIKEALAVIEK